ncbi:MAG TPA: protein kinase [Kofleriaceae bacterium]|nr:protein kinase [Kofleriaceae bacterium]
MAADDDDPRRQGGAPPPQKKTQFGMVIPTPSGAPQAPQAPRVPAATPQPPATNKTTFGVPSPMARPPAQRVTPAPMPVQRVTPATTPAQPQPQPPPSNATTGTAHGQATDQDLPHDVIASGMGLEPGGRVHQYELIRELGRGGMGMVWAARDTKLGRRVAIKFLLDASRSVADRFLTEARATAQCNHENIVIIHEVDEIESMPYMVLEFLEGQPLRGVMGTYGSGMRLAPTRVVELMLPVARALARAHELGIVHRDLKPENVFVTNAGQVKVLDFGIAKAVARRDPQAQQRSVYGDLHAQGANLNMTREGALIGTLPYMSPEQMGIGEVDHRSDIWAFGIMLYEMLAGRHPVYPLTSEALITNAVSEDAMPSVRSDVPDVPDALAWIVDSCLRKRVVERMPRATDLVKKLEELMPGRAGRQLAEGESPYPGLTAFQEADADRFFGRTREVARMTARIREFPITGIVGPSGAGKSSFIRAGVGPALKASGEHWEVVTLRPGRQPLAALASIVQRLTTRSGVDVQTQVADHHTLLQRLRGEPGFVGTLLRNRARQTGTQILLFVDQFEELYTLVPDPNERRAFTAALTGVADDTAAPLRVVVSMRSDFLDRIAEDQRFMEELSRGLVFLQPPDRAGLREALVAPIEMVGHRFESAAMVEDMLDALVNTPGALPLLQFAAAKLWDARDRQRRLLTVASYNSIGGISGALATHADDIVAQMNDRMQRLTQKIFRRLVTPERTRAIVELADLYQLAPDQAEVSRTIDQLVSARLLMVQTRGDTGSSGGGSVEIVHESLIDRWPTLRRWLDEDQEDAAFLSQLSSAAKQWEAKGRSRGLLWTGDAMEEARRWSAQRPRELPAREQAFLDAVFSHAQRGKRAKRALLIATFALLGIVAAGASVAAVKIRDSEQQAKTALSQIQQKEAERDRAEAAQKAAETEKARAEEAKQKAELDKQKAELEKHKAEQDKLAAEAMSREQLQAKNLELQKTLDEVQTAKATAEKAKEIAVKEKQNAERARDEANAAKAKIQAELDRQRQENAKLSHKLK